MLMLKYKARYGVRRLGGSLEARMRPRSRRSTTRKPSAPCFLRTTHPCNGATLTMNDSSEYVPPKVWIWNKPSGGTFANINRPVAGPTQDKELPVGRHPLQLYSLGTPNGVKVTIMLEELLALGHS